ncbi:MAG: glycosyltransferase family 4 protein [Gammaproteobacteria bacterium]|nr:glycosyltransferase WbuB [Gammaproteobacteria bacterium]
MKLLLLTFYYPPDLSAGSFRAAALAEALLRAGGRDVEVDVLTTRPHRYASYRDAAAERARALERSGALTVTRLPVGFHRSGLLDQSVVFMGFAARALRAVRGKRYDIVVATSSRLLTGYLGARIARRTGATFYLDVRDMFLDNVREMFRIPGKALLVPVLRRIERETFSTAARVNLVSEAFLDYCRHRFPPRPYSFFSNGIDREFLEFDFREPPSDGLRTIVYAGNIGLGQGLTDFVPEAARVLGDGYAFRIIGDGGQREALAARLAAAGVRNVTLLPPMSRDALLDEYRRAHYLLLHLNGFSSLEKVLPSKVFEYAATGKPILAGVRGYARQFITKEIDGAAVFDPGDAHAMARALRSLEPAHFDRTRFKEAYRRDRLMDAMAMDILSAAAVEPRRARRAAPVGRAAAG